MKIYPIFIPHVGCPYECIYCNQYSITKTKQINFDNLEEKIFAFQEKNKSEDMQIAFFGGTFTALSIMEMKKYLDFANRFKKITIRISTRPDTIDKNIVSFLKDSNVDTVELGVQSFSDDVLEKSGRNYSLDTIEKSCNLIKKYDINLGIQLMVGLPGENKESFLYSIKNTKLIMPNFVRIYPTLVLKNTLLATMFLSNEYKPLNLETVTDWCTKAKFFFDNNKIKVIKIGLHSDIDLEEVLAGPYHQNFAELVKANVLIYKVMSYKKKFEKVIFSSYDISLFYGNKKIMLEKLKEKALEKNFIFEFSNNVQKSEILFL